MPLGRTEGSSPGPYGSGRITGQDGRAVGASRNQAAPAVGALALKDRFLPGLPEVGPAVGARGGRRLRGVRGATVVPWEAEKAEAAVAELLTALLAANGIREEDLAAVFFSLPPELEELRAAQVARQLGWKLVPLFETRQPVRSDDLPRCLRVMLLWNTDRAQSEVRHVYLGEAARLRPDLAGEVGLGGEKP